MLADVPGAGTSALLGEWMRQYVASHNHVARGEMLQGATRVIFERCTEARGRRSCLLLYFNLDAPSQRPSC